jgi:DNA polymerase I
MGKSCVIDIETDGLKPTKIHCLVVLDTETGKGRVFESGVFVQTYLDTFATIIAHNGCSYDFPVLKKLWSVDIPFEKQVDTVVMSRLFMPDREKGHSLEAWGERLGFPKAKYEGGWQEYSEEMLAYCKQDTRVCARVYSVLLEDQKNFSEKSVRDEHRMQILAEQVQDHGFRFNVPAALDLYNSLMAEQQNISKKMQEVFPPAIVQLKTKIKYIPFNPASRKQIGERLIPLGWKPRAYTETGLPKVDEYALEACSIPEAAVLARYFMLQKRTGMLDSWIKAANSDNRVRCNYHTLGAVTNRMSCSSPNLQQIPSLRKPYGLECRQLWKAEMGNKLIDADAQGLELRVLAHYVNDPAYTAEILDGDIHTANQKMAGLETRDQAKTFIYALLYGAGAAKIGTVVGGSASDGKRLRDRFLANLPAFNRFQRAVLSKAESGGVLKAIDGRLLRVRHPHAAVNTLIQGSSAVLMKKWFLYTDYLLNKKDARAAIVAMVHDEMVIETSISTIELSSECVKLGISQVNKSYGLRCPLGCDVKIGNNWSEIH